MGCLGRSGMRSNRRLEWGNSRRIGVTACMWREAWPVAGGTSSDSRRRACSIRSRECRCLSEV